MKNPARWALLIVQKQLIELTTGVQASTALSKLSTSFNWSGPIGVARSIWGDDDNDEDDDDNVVDYDSHQLAWQIASLGDGARYDDDGHKEHEDQM